MFWYLNRIGHVGSRFTLSVLLTGIPGDCLLLRERFLCSVQSDRRVFWPIKVSGCRLFGSFDVVLSLPLVAFVGSH